MKQTLLKIPQLTVMIVMIGSYHLQLSAQEKNIDNSQMKSFISIFEIPATDLERAVKFYETILEIEIETIDMQGMKMGLLPSDGQQVSGVITKGEGYQPSAEGVLIYLNAGDDMELMLSKIESSGGEIVVPKTLIDEQNGYFALFIDSEGNRIGLHAMQ